MKTESAKFLVSHSYGITYKELKEDNVWEVYCMKMPRRSFESEKKYKTLYRASLKIAKRLGLSFEVKNPVVLKINALDLSSQSVLSKTEARDCV
ncbi:hypothetical protein P618_200787 [Holospora obtusa F1]|uniref:Uncharacterized protein n=1 Tax=Holospora obtusa F1 TaxID=1399147 RepID=W6TDX5_HOLOB|nr:hypothetical protein [Holospora obtusa]ETZ07016.1 hypothetical protein P618_200787 [Holospora obtusa F1]